MNLESVYRDIRNLYFPRWDVDEHWIARFGSPEQRRYHTGYCDTKDKTLYFDRDAVNAMMNDGFRAFVIHEICHDVGAAFHNRRWADRMEQAACRADRLGESEVAEILRSDVWLYAGDGVLLEYNSDNVSEFAAELRWTKGITDVKHATIGVAKYFGHSVAKVRRDFEDYIADAISGR